MVMSGIRPSKCITADDRNKANRLIKKTCSIIGHSMETIDHIVKKKRRRKLQTVLHIEAILFMVSLKTVKCLQGETVDAVCVCVCVCVCSSFLANSFSAMGDQ